MAKWFKAPNTPGLWWYWLLGSAAVRVTQVSRLHGYGWTTPKKLAGKLCVWTDGWGEAANKARLWCRGTRTPKLPPLKLQKWLERKYCGPIVRSRSRRRKCDAR